MIRDSNKKAPVAASARRPISVQITEPRPAPVPADLVVLERAAILDRAPALRSDKATARLLRILDSLPALDERGEL